MESERKPLWPCACSASRRANRTEPMQSHSHFQDLLQVSCKAGRCWGDPRVLLHMSPDIWFSLRSLATTAPLALARWLLSVKGGQSGLERGICRIMQRGWRAIWYHWPFALRVLPYLQDFRDASRYNALIILITTTWGSASVFFLRGPICARPERFSQSHSCGAFN